MDIRSVRVLSTIWHPGHCQLQTNVTLIMKSYKRVFELQPDSNNLTVTFIHTYYEVMQLITLLAFSGALFSAFGGIQAASNFRATCTQIFLKSDNNYAMRASCRKIDGSYSDTVLDLNHCLANRNGKLQYQIE